MFKGLHNHLPINAYESYLDLLKSGDNSVFTSTLMLVSSGLHNRCYAIIDEVWLSENYTKCEHQNSQCFPYELRKSFYHNSPMLVAVPVQLDQLVLGGPLLGIPNTYLLLKLYVPSMDVVDYFHVLFDRISSKSLLCRFQIVC